MDECLAGRGGNEKECGLPRSAAAVELAPASLSVLEFRVGFACRNLLSPPSWLIKAILFHEAFILHLSNISSYPYPTHSSTDLQLNSPHFEGNDTTMDSNQFREAAKAATEESEYTSTTYMTPERATPISHHDRNDDDEDNG
jgi:hypothetical protein